MTAFEEWSEGLDWGEDEPEPPTQLNLFKDEL